MDKIQNFFNNLELDITAIVQIGAPILLGILVLALCGRFIFGKKSGLNNTLSSVMGILFLYILTIVLECTGSQLSTYTAPLPFISIADNQLILFSFTGAGISAICKEALGLIILSFLVNIADRWLPKGKRLLSWIFFRFLTVVIALALHWMVMMLLPEEVMLYAAPILVGLLLLLLLLGALKLVISVILAIANPLISALYTFFFSNMIGKQITKAMVTAAVFAGLIFLLQTLGFGVLSLAQAALIGYLPYLGLLILLWFVVSRLL